jgi:hypothetical protein
MHGKIANNSCLGYLLTSARICAASHTAAVGALKDMRDFVQIVMDILRLCGLSYRSLARQRGIYVCHVRCVLVLHV